MGSSEQSLVVRQPRSKITYRTVFALDLTKTPTSIIMDPEKTAEDYEVVTVVTTQMPIMKTTKQVGPHQNAQRR